MSEGSAGAGFFSYPGAGGGGSAGGANTGWDVLAALGGGGAAGSGGFSRDTRGVLPRCWWSGAWRGFRGCGVPRVGRKEAAGTGSAGGCSAAGAGG